MMGAAFDLAERSGWAVGEPGRTPTWGTLDLPGFSDRDLARSMASIYSAVRQIVQANKVKLVGIEAPLRGIARKNKRGITTPTSSHGERCLTMLAGAAMAGAANGGAHVLPPVAPQTWRKAVLGNGYPDDPKAAALAYCKMLGWKVTDHNAAEACCILNWTLGQRHGSEAA